MRVSFRGIPDENLASYRFRIKSPVEHMLADGIDAGVNLPDADVVVFSKHWHPIEDQTLAARLHKDGKGVIFDICDDHFETQHREHYKRMCDMADAVVVCTERLKERVLEETGRDAVVIQDPYDFDEHDPRAIGDPPSLLYYGHANNMPAIEREYLRLAGRYPLRVLSNVAGTGITPYSRQAQADGYRDCDIVIIPTINTPKNAAKSPNRMVDAIRQGRFVVANPMPQYEGYGMYLGDIVEGIEWVRKNRSKALAALREAQALVSRRHDPLMLARSWASLCASTWDAAASFGKISST